ncbi:MAG: response regulator [Candidatus Omnitrophica bacterium]|nr:response regulator [Candidatus Omnitrophota bacterium]
MDKKILIIDDSEQDKKIMVRYLTRAGFDKIATAENGNNGLQKFEAENPDIVILDTMMPDTVGFEVCKKIRELKGFQRPKIVITTGSIDAVDALRAKESGADDYCVKTSDCEPLLNAINKLF